MKKKLIEFAKKPFVKNVLILSSGTAGAQAIAMLSSPIVTRLYGPEAYGIMGAFVAIISIISPIAALTMPIAIVLPKSDKEARGLVKLSLIITIIIAGLIGLLLILFNNFIIEVFNFQNVSGYLFLIPIVILMAGLLEVTEQWLIRNKQFSVSAKVVLLQAIIVNGGKVGFGFFNPVASVLIAFSAFTQGIKAALVYLLTKNYTHRISFNLLKIKVSIKDTLKKYKDFPLFRAPEVLINGVTQNMPLILMATFFGPVAAGFYSICKTVLNAPSNLIGNSVGNVFYPKISEAANNNENLPRLIKKATFALSIVGAVPYGIIVLFGPWLFNFVFGEGWVVAGEYARWVALWSYFSFINKPSVKALPVLSAQAFQLKYTIIILVTQTISLLIGFYVFSSDKIAVAIFGITGALLNVGLIFITLRISRKFKGDK
ncbi:oligosaccharide flippase family protein [Ralstonia pickettii]|nr:oligosaccharide flippase family protein [Ralstonia pickettii]